jgi:hypothetical protein
MRTNHAEQPWALPNRNLLGCFAIRAGFPGASRGSVARCRCYTEGVSARAAVNSVDAGDTIWHE